MEESIYSSQFNLLKLWGAWPLQTSNRFKKNLYFLYSMFSMVFVLFVSYTGVLNFIEVIRDFRKLAWNLCVNVITVTSLGKNIHLYLQSEEINSLRKKIYRSIKTCKNSEEIDIYKKNIKKYRNIMKCFHYPFMIFFPLWGIDSIYWLFKKGEYPMPQNWPWEVDKNNFLAKGSITGLHLFTACILLINGITTDLGIYSILLQIMREYEFLLKSIRYMNDYCSEGSENELDENYQKKIKKKTETNEELKNKEAKKMLHKILVRQRELLGYTQHFEKIFSGLLFFQLFIGGFNVVINAVQTMTLSLEFQVKTTPQGAYSTVILIDILIFCLLSHDICELCRKVGEGMYELPWYSLNIDLRKDILFIILKSQKPPRISAAKIIELNMETFSEATKNMYRWLAVFRQLGFT